jgi:hypothetical protein
MQAKTEAKTSGRNRSGQSRPRPANAAQSPARVRVRGDWSGPFLAELARTGTIVQAARYAGIAPRTVYWRMDRDPDFRQSVEACHCATFDAIFDEVIHRASVGDVQEVPIYFKGKNDPQTGMPIVVQVGTKMVRQKSDKLLELLARILMPEKYGGLPWVGFDRNRPTGRDIHRIAVEVAAALGLSVNEVMRMARDQSSAALSDRR